MFFSLGVKPCPGAVVPWKLNVGNGAEDHEGGRARDPAATHPVRPISVTLPDSFATHISPLGPSSFSTHPPPWQLLVCVCLFLRASPGCWNLLCLGHSGQAVLGTPHTSGKQPSTYKFPASSPLWRENSDAYVLQVWPMDVWGHPQETTVIII